MEETTKRKKLSRLGEDQYADSRDSCKKTN